MSEDAGVTVGDGTTAATYDPESGTVTVSGSGLSASLELSVEVRTDSGSYPQTKDARSVAIDDGVRVRHDDDLNTSVELCATDDCVDVTIVLHNRSADTVRVRELALVATAPATWEAGASIYENGIQDSSAVGTLPAGQSFEAESPRKIPLKDDRTRAPGADRTSNYLTAIAGPESAVAMGFLDHSRYFNRFDYWTTDDDGIVAIDAVCAAEGKPVAPGTRLASAPLRVDPSDRAVATALEGIAAETGDRMDARIPEEPPTGWCSWYRYFGDVTEPDVRENLDELDRWDVPVSLVQVDDGYQEAWGDWQLVNDDFDDLEALVTDVKARGFTPGLWLSPFVVFDDSRTYEQHPEWLVEYDDPEDTVWGIHGDQQRYGLDTTHPDAQQWLRDVFETVVDDWGFEYVKLDFMKTGAIPGTRYDDSVTRAEAYRRGLEIIRESVGEETKILGCGSPLGPDVGLVDAHRVGNDIARRWGIIDHDAISEHSGAGLRNSIRSVLNRQLFHRNWFVCDPDTQILGQNAEGDELTDVEKETFAAVVSLTGGSNIISDELVELGDWERDLFEATLPPVAGGRVPALGEEFFPDTVVCDRPADGGTAIASFNWDDGAATVGPDAVANAVPEDPLGWEPRRADVRESLDRRVPGHGCQVLHLARKRDRPFLVGTRSHLAGGADRVTAVEWADGTLSLEADAAFEYVVAVPDGWTTDDTTAPLGAYDSGSVVAVAGEAGETTITFDRD